MNGRRTFPVRIPISPYMFDHRPGGPAVYPAAEIIHILSETARKTYPGADISCSQGAEFLRFLPLPENVDGLDADVELAPDDSGRIRAALFTEFKSPRAGITRPREHARMTFGPAPELPALPMDIAGAVEGICRKIGPEPLYREIVKLGPAYQNIREGVYLSPDGASAYLYADSPAEREEPSGSPFVIDAAFHAACVWGYCYTGRVTIPVGYEQRFVRQRTVPRERYYCRVIPKNINPEELTFDLWIYDLQGECREAVRGLKMREAFPAGREVPPELRAGPENPLLNLEENCLGLTVIELNALAPFSSRSFSEPETSRDKMLGEKRKKSHAGGRIALKRLVRKLRGSAVAGGPAIIDTFKVKEGNEFYWSVAHDRRFALAAAGAHPIGADVEPENDRILKCRGIFLSGKEKILIAESSGEQTAALLRVWGIKEAAAKALKIPLAGAWKKVEVTKIGARESVVMINRQSFSAHHASAEGHLFTILELA
ncbi:MAG: polyketide synthase dehydratase domain-containing protein [bacterium]|nr:polyketide synthase dehydratase domain-containing protein [bacterium]